MSVTIYHNPRCSKSRQTLALLQKKGATPKVVEYLKTPPSAAELKTILAKLGLKAREILRTGEPPYRELGLDDPSLDDDALVLAPNGIGVGGANGASADLRLERRPPPAQVPRRPADRRPMSAYGLRAGGFALLLSAIWWLMAVVVGVAAADTFRPANSPPSMGPAQVTVSPGVKGATIALEYSVEVADPESLHDLARLELCLYAADGGDGPCSVPDPATNVTVAWTEATGAFTIDDGQGAGAWRLGTGEWASAVPALSGTRGTFAFRIRVVRTSILGEWRAVATATDRSGASAGVHPVSLELTSAGVNDDLRAAKRLAKAHSLRD